MRAGANASLGWKMKRRGKAARDSATARRKHYRAPALEKGLDVLELLAREPQGLTISELAHRLGRTVGELFRMVVVLEQRSYVQMREDSDAYVLTLRMFEMSHRFPPVARLTSAAGPVMKNLSHDTGQSCHMVIYYEGQGHVVAQYDAPTDRIFSVRLGAIAPLLDTCSGHILLAFADEDSRRSMLSKIPDPKRRPNAREIGRMVKRVRGQGNEIVASAQVQGVMDIGFPVFDHAGYIAAALVMPFLEYLDGSHPVSADRAAELTEAAAKDISTALGLVGRSAIASAG